MGTSIIPLLPNGISAGGNGGIFKKTGYADTTTGININSMMFPNFENRPTITEGTQLLIFTFAPTEPTGILIIGASLLLTQNVANELGIAVFNSIAGTNAIYYARHHTPVASSVNPVMFEFRYPYPVGGIHTLSLRAGVEFTGRQGYLNKNSSTQYGAGAMRSTFYAYQY